MDVWAPPALASGARLESGLLSQIMLPAMVCLSSQHGTKRWNQLAVSAELLDEGYIPGTLWQGQLSLVVQRYQYENCLDNIVISWFQFLLLIFFFFFNLALPVYAL